MDLLNTISELETYPVLGMEVLKEQYVQIDLSIHNTRLKVSLENGLDQYILSIQAAKPRTIFYGGYKEHRNLYTSSLFEKEKDRRCIHMGVDLWSPYDTPIYAPLEGTVHSYRYNDKDLDYGYTVILKHEIHGQLCYTLYGHLSSYNFDTLQKGMFISKGQHFCNLGDKEENGGWPPHLHFQIIMDIDDYDGDYPGVVSLQEVEKYTHICPNPTALALGY